LSGLPLAHFWERGIEGVRVEMCVHSSFQRRGTRSNPLSMSEWPQ
jgi:hypothetical protein